MDEGEIVALIGANGAGKTTTLHTISGMLQAKSGSVQFEGREIVKMPGHQIVSLGMSHVPEGRRVFAGLYGLREPQDGRLHPQGQERDRRDA